MHKRNNIQDVEKEISKEILLENVTEKYSNENVQNSDAASISPSSPAEHDENISKSDFSNKDVSKQGTIT